MKQKQAAFTHMWSGRALERPALSKLAARCYDPFKKRQIEMLKRQMHDSPEGKFGFQTERHSHTRLKRNKPVSQRIPFNGKLK